MASTDLAPRRGEIWLVAFGAARRGEPDRNRPAIVVLADHLSQGAMTDLVAVVPLSGTLAASALRPEVPPGSGADRPSRAITRALRGVAPSRMLRRLGALDPSAMREVERALAAVLGLPLPA